MKQSPEALPLMNGGLSKNQIGIILLKNQSQILETVKDKLTLLL